MYNGSAHTEQHKALWRTIIRGTFCKGKKSRVFRSALAINVTRARSLAQAYLL